jgi:acyl-CoA thioester hydrolase
MEQAEHEYFRSLGLSIMQPAGDDAYIGWPRVSATCTFEAPAYFEDELDVLLNVTRKGVKSLTMEIEFWRGGVRIAHGRLKTACCICRHHQPLESIPIPAEYDEKIQEAESPQP